MHAVIRNFQCTGYELKKIEKVDIEEKMSFFFLCYGYFIALADFSLFFYVKPPQ